MTSPLTDEQLKDMLAGCEGVTPEPWERQGSSVRSVATGYIMETSGSGSYVGALSSPRGGEQRDVDAAYIARCDPQTISSLIAELLELRAERGKE